MSIYSEFYKNLQKVADEDSGWLKAQMAASKAMSEDGVGGVLADTDLMADRGAEALKGSGLFGLLGLILGGLAGASVGAVLGGDLESTVDGALAGGGLGGAAGAVGGAGLGVAKADKQFLADKGLDAKLPIPVKTMLAPFPVAAVAPISSHAKIQIGSKAMLDKRAESKVPGLTRPKQSRLERSEARQRIASNIVGAGTGLALTSGKAAKKHQLNRFHKLLAGATGAKAADQVVETAHNARRAQLTDAYYERRRRYRQTRKRKQDNGGT